MSGSPADPSPPVRHEVKRTRFSTADEKIANIDGVIHIRYQLTTRPHDLPLDGLGPDFYQLAENVHKGCRIVCGKRPSPGGTSAIYTQTQGL